MENDLTPLKEFCLLFNRYHPQVFERGTVYKEGVDVDDASLHDDCMQVLNVQLLVSLSL